MVSDLYRLGGSDGDAKTSRLQIGGTTSYSNGNNTAGLTVNQSAADDECVSLKSSDVEHGMTSHTETDTYGVLKKAAGAAGGLAIQGWDDYAVTTTAGALLLEGYIGGSPDTTKSTAAKGIIRLVVGQKSGTTVAASGANGNLVTVENGSGTCRFIFDADGDSHQDVGTAWTNFDQYDDAALLNVLAAEVARPGDPIKEEFRGWMDYHRGALEEAGLVAFHADGHHFVNMSRLTMLLVGAVRQQGLRLREMDRRLLPAG